MTAHLRMVALLFAVASCLTLKGFAAETKKPEFETRTFPIGSGIIGMSLGHVYFSDGTNSVPISSHEDLKRCFEKAGIPFPPGASVSYDDRLTTLIVVNTGENMERFERVLQKLNALSSQVTIETRFLRMPRDTAEDLFKPEVNLAKVSLVHEDVLRRIRELVRQKEITVLAQPKVTTVSGNTAQVKSVEEFRYPTEFTVTPTASTNATSKTTTESAILVPSGFETRELGTLLNVTLTLGPDGQTINLTLVPEISTKGEPSSKIEVATPNGKVAVEQPRFRSRQITTTIQILSGSTILLGVADPIESEDRDQIVLVLLTATVVYLQ